MCVLGPMQLCHSVCECFSAWEGCCSDVGEAHRKGWPDSCYGTTWSNVLPHGMSVPGRLSSASRCTNWDCITPDRDTTEGLICQRISLLQSTLLSWRCWTKFGGILNICELRMMLVSKTQYQKWCCAARQATLLSPASMSGGWRLVASALILYFQMIYRVRSLFPLERIGDRGGQDDKYHPLPAFFNK